jgi:hypothetical protein
LGEKNVELRLLPENYEPVTKQVKFHDLIEGRIINKNTEDEVEEEKYEREENTIKIETKEGKKEEKLNEEENLKETLGSIRSEMEKEGEEVKMKSKAEQEREEDAILDQILGLNSKPFVLKYYTYI